MDINSAVSTVLNEITMLLKNFRSGEVVTIINEIIAANRVFIAGSGRVQLISKCFAKRLAHSKVNIHVIGETTTPPVANGDLVIIASCSGTTMIPLAIAEKASKLGAKIFGITACPDSPLAGLCNHIVTLSSPEYKQEKADVISSQPMNNLFEQGLHIVFDIISWAVQLEKGISIDILNSRHANIE